MTQTLETLRIEEAIATNKIKTVQRLQTARVKRIIKEYRQQGIKGPYTIDGKVYNAYEATQ